MTQIGGSVIDPKFWATNASVNNTSTKPITITDLVTMQHLFDLIARPFISTPDAIECSLATFKYTLHLFGTLEPGDKHNYLKVRPDALIMGVRVFENNDLAFGEYKLGFNVKGKFVESREA